MEYDQHPDPETLLAVAAGEPGGPAVARHVAACRPCGTRLSELRAVLDAAHDELLDLRPDCPSTEELALIPPGGEADHPHVRDCPLCRDEIRLVFEHETHVRLGTALGDGPFVRPELLVAAGTTAYQAADEAAALTLEPGAETTVRIAGARVRLEVVGAELVATVTGSAERPLVLVLSDEVLEKRVPLGGTVRLPVGRWQRVRVELGSASQRPAG